MDRNAGVRSAPLDALADPLSVNFIAAIARRLGADATQRALEDGRALEKAFPARR